MGMGASRLRTLFFGGPAEPHRGMESASLISMSRALSEFGSISIIAYYVLQYPFYGVSPASVSIYELFTGGVTGGLDAAVTASAVMILVLAPHRDGGALRQEEVDPPAQPFIPCRPLWMRRCAAPRQRPLERR